MSLMGLQVSVINLYKTRINAHSAAFLVIYFRRGVTHLYLNPVTWVCNVPIAGFTLCVVAIGIAQSEGTDL